MAQVATADSADHYSATENDCEKIKRALRQVSYGYEW